MECRHKHSEVLDFIRISSIFEFEPVACCLNLCHLLLLLYSQAVVAMLGGIEALVAMLKRVNRRYHDSTTLSTKPANARKLAAWGSRKMSLKEDAIDDFQVWHFMKFTLFLNKPTQKV